MSGGLSADGGDSVSGLGDGGATSGAPGAAGLICGGAATATALLTTRNAETSVVTKIVRCMTTSLARARLLNTSNLLGDPSRLKKGK